MHGRLRRRVVAAVPVLVPTSMWATFAILRRHVSPHTAYNLGFTVYWGVWCFAVPAVVMGPRRAAELLRIGRSPGPATLLLLLVPAAGGVRVALAPNRRRIDVPLAAVMIGTATVNAVGEELLWRGLFLDTFPEEPVAGVVWPLAGFALWHLAPQTVLPSTFGRWQFVAGATLVGLGSAVAAWRGRGLRYTLLPHIATDSCGVVAAEFRLGRPRP